MTRGFPGLVAAALMLSACLSAPPVPVRGQPSALAALAGEWDGTYSSRETGRSGSIWFALVAGEDHAHGDVLMTAAGASVAYRRLPSASNPSRETERARPDTFLTIRFVRAADGWIDGVLDPYWDPDCGCQVTTAFRGRIGDGLVGGTFVSRFGESIATGRWVVSRRRTRREPAPPPVDFSQTVGNSPLPGTR
jgi:hypothetical protein